MRGSWVAVLCSVAACVPTEPRLRPPRAEPPPDAHAGVKRPKSTVTLPAVPRLPTLPKPRPPAAGKRRVTLQLGNLRCTFVLAGEPGKITRIDVVEQSACRAATIFRTADEPRGSFYDDINGNVLQAEADHDFMVADFNFDGFADVAVTRYVHPKSISRVHWLYEPRQRAWVRSPQLDALGWPEPDVTPGVLAVYFPGDSLTRGTTKYFRWRSNRLVPVPGGGR